MIDKDFRYFGYLGDKCIRKVMKGYLSDLDYLLSEGIIDDETKENLRKSILDSGNGEARFFTEQAEFYFKLNEDNLAEYPDGILAEELENRGYTVKD